MARRGVRCWGLDKRSGVEDGIERRWPELSFLHVHLFHWQLQVKWILDLGERDGLWNATNCQGFLNLVQHEGVEEVVQVLWINFTLTVVWIDSGQHVGCWVEKHRWRESPGNCWLDSEPRDLCTMEECSVLLGCLDTCLLLPPLPVLFFFLKPTVVATSHGLVLVEHD